MLKNYNAKLNWQASQKRHGLGLLVPGRARRSSAASPGSRGCRTTSKTARLWDQGDVYPDGQPHGLCKVE